MRCPMGDSPPAHLQPRNPPAPLLRGPRVRIRLPAARSRVRTRSCPRLLTGRGSRFRRLSCAPNKQLPDPNSLFAASVSTRCARRVRPEAGRRPRYRKFESISLQQRVCLWCDFIFVVKNRGLPRGFPGCVPGAVGREPQGPPTLRQPGAISLSGHIPVPRFRRCATSRWVKKSPGWSAIRDRTFFGSGGWWILRVRDEAQTKPSAVR
jgi:hypothetical protein